MKPARGFAILAVMVVIACLGISGAIAWNHLASRRTAARAELRRTQALWLARSAAAARRPLQARLSIDGEEAKLSAAGAGSRFSAQASFARWGTAKVESDGKNWDERWEARPNP